MAADKKAKKRQQRKEQAAQRRRRRQEKRRPVPAPARKETLSTLAHHVQQSYDLSDVMLIATPAGERKISEALLDFIAPYRRSVLTVQQIETLIQVGALAWNAALLPGEEQSEIVEDLAQAVSTQHDSVRDLLNSLIERKLAHFSDDMRIIVDYQLVVDDSGSGFHLTVTAVPVIPRPAEEEGQ